MEKVGIEHRDRVIRSAQRRWRVGLKPSTRLGKRPFLATGGFYVHFAPSTVGK